MKQSEKTNERMESKFARLYASRMQSNRSV
jgi:hypothetical protein